MQGLTEQNHQLQQRADSAEAREEEAWKMQSKAEARAKDAENQLAGSRQVAEAAKLRGDKLKAENDALKSQPHHRGGGRGRGGPAGPEKKRTRWRQI